MFNYTGTELANIDQVLEPKLSWATTRYAEAHQLALDATRLLSCTNDRLEEYKNKGFFKRVWYRLSGKTGNIQRANQSDLIEAQKIGWRYIEILNERGLLQAETIISIRNNLRILATREEETRRQVTRLADLVHERFVRLEDRVDKLEAAQQIHAWLLTIETRDYDEKYPPHLRMLRIVKDFMALKPGSWTMTELRYLQKALKDTGISYKRELSLEDFVDEVVNEIGTGSFDTYKELLLGAGETRRDPSRVQENVAVPSYSALFEIANTYSISSATIDVLQQKLSIGRSEAIKLVLQEFMRKQGIELQTKVQLRWLAIELLDCMQLERALAHGSEREPLGPGEHPVGPFKPLATGERSDVDASDPKSQLLAAREVTITWDDPRYTELVITKKDGGWSATIEDALTDRAVLAVKPGEKSREIFVLNEMSECKIGYVYGGELRLSDLEEVVIVEASRRPLLQSDSINIRLKYATTQFPKNVLGKVTWL